MGRGSDKLTVFVSSTAEDLRDHRLAARLEIAAAGWNAVLSEDFGALPESVVQACKERIRTCDAVLLLQAFRRGWVPTAAQGGDGRSSITAIEVACAKELGIPLLVMLADGASWPGVAWEPAQADRDWVDQFRKQLDRPAELFSAEPADAKLTAFRTKVRGVLLAHKERQLQRTEVCAEDLDVAVQGVLDGASVPFLGLGIYDGTALGREALIRALGGDVAAEEPCLATVAEYWERKDRLRPRFLERLARIIREQQALLATAPAVHDMVLRARTPRLVVSATYDWVLEERLEASRTPFVLVAHVVRSRSGEEDGKILVFRPGQPPDLTTADKVILGDPQSLVVYKPLGSPLLNERLEATAPTAGKALDTVTITETDHVLFLGRLRTQATQFPTVFTRVFQTSTLLLLGYSLDLWNYRLVLQVLRMIGSSAQGASVSVQAVIDPHKQSPMEKEAWSRLDPNLVHLSPERFAQQVLARVGAHAA